MSNRYTFLLKNQPFEVSVNYSFFVNVGEDIGQHLLSSKKYIVKSNVHPQNFQEFLTYLTVNNNDLNINSRNYHDFYLLNEEFNHLLSDILLKPEYSALQEESKLDILISTEAIDKSSIEKDIASKLDYFLLNYNEKMSQIPFTSLYNIFNHENRKLNDHEKAYQFMIQNIDRSENNENKKSFCILLGSLEATKLNEKSINDSILKRDEHFGFAPRSNDSFVCSVNKNISELKNQIDSKFEQFFSIVMNHQQKIDEKFNSIENKYELLSNKINETKQQINEIQNNIQQISQRIENSNHDDEITNNLQQIQSKIDSIQNNCQEISQRIENSNHDDEITNNLQQIQSKVDSIQNNCQQISQRIENSNHDDEITNNLQQLRSKVDSISQKTENIIKLKHDRFDIIRKLMKESGGNAIERGIIDVTSLSYSNDYKPSNAVLFDNLDKVFASKNESGSWIRFEFKRNQVIPINYTIRTTNGTFTSYCHPRNFVFECSNDDNNWEILDEQNECSFLHGNNLTHVFNIQKPSSKSYRFVRIRSTGIDWNSANYLVIGSFDVYGALLSE